VVTLLEVVGVGAILPFMKIVATENFTEEPGWGMRLAEITGFSEHRSFVILTGAIVFVLISLSNLVKIYVRFRQQKLVWGISQQLSSRLLALYLSRSYSFFLGKNSVELKVKILQEVNTFTTGILVPIQNFIAQTSLVLVIFCLLLAVNPWLAMSALFFLASIFSGIYLVRRRELRNLGEKRVAANVRRYRSLLELFSGIKVFLVYQVDRFFHGRFSQAVKEYSEIQPRIFLMTFAPRMIVEIHLRHNSNIVDALYDDIFHPMNGSTPFPPKPCAPIAFNRKIEFENLTFQYETAASSTLTNINLEILHGQSVAFIGSTGSGKSTIVDLIVGLLSPQIGEIRVDNELLTASTIPGWQKLLAYVPQDVILFDDTIANNIAVGVKEVDYDLLYQVAKTAKIFDFIDRELPEGFETTVGERGARVSGGQKQRIGLARALYRQPKVLVLDEATSALDNLTERQVLESLEENAQQLTIIVVAHRLATVRNADKIYFLSRGEIVDSGSYNELLSRSREFQELAKLN